ncbi:P-loop containing nucleoside triphosphate hydrolase protein [Mycena albidolilacea]|uniref:P-loop containing nucleoside triphosphate hydrolase protein n=1 Tax=Mycena albidolilacea TaxID=1033008 RepID=A0AAD7AF40_9AGAR|nr:P-loop containing nucleoside triphosphate hydrolase protein [Mycena albidolilacea]
MRRGPRFRRNRGPDPGEGTFDPEDTQKVKHTRIGIWDLYEEVEPRLKHVPGYFRSRLETFHEVKHSVPFILRMFKEIGAIRACWWLLAGYLIITLVLALVPAVELWYAGLLLKIVQNAIAHRTVDRNLLFQVAASRLICNAITRLLQHGQGLLYKPLNERIRQHYAIQSFHARARLDVPTYSDSSVLRQLDNSTTSSRSSVAWNNVLTILHLVSTGVELVSQFSVLFNLLRDQRDGTLLAALSFGHTLFRRKVGQKSWSPSGVWAATTRDPDYLRSLGMARVVNQQEHRKELVAGGMVDYLVSSYRGAAERLGNQAMDFYEAFSTHKLTDRLNLTGFLSDPLRELPQIVFTLRAVQYPSDIPLSLASLNLITQTTSKFSRTLFDLFEQTGSVADNLASIRKLYETYSIPNIVADGVTPFPEDQQKLRLGVALEFRNVSFRYPGSQKDVLRNVSFKILQGQLCVIVGANGSGKSTILKLVARLYDATEGQIFVNDQDIRTLKLADLRRATSVLFQDYTYFPLSIKDNIALGDPENAHDDHKIRDAATLGGATEFIERLDEGFDTYLERPVDDIYSALPQGTKTLFGRSVEYSSIRGAGGMRSHSKGLSGGQMQRIALSRTFMRDDGVGLLCFDEPSASLDPVAEHDLFERLRKLRGNKTMIFSTHRFGNLTRHADLILYMDNAVILEEGTHNDLIKQEGGYAKIWNLQAQAFLP